MSSVLTIIRKTNYNSIVGLIFYVVVKDVIMGRELDNSTKINTIFVITLSL